MHNFTHSIPFMIIIIFVYYPKHLSKKNLKGIVLYSQVKVQNYHSSGTEKLLRSVMVFFLSLTAFHDA